MSKVVIIDSSRRSLWFLLKEILGAAPLIYHLARREIRVRYQQTSLGLAWALIQPIATTLLFTIVFGYLNKLQSEGFPYALFAFTGLLPWTFFASAVAGATNSFFNNANMVRKVYFPRLSIPLAAVLSAGFDFLISVCVYFPLAFYFGVTPSLRVFLLPLGLAMAFLTAVSVALLFASVVGIFRDLRHIVPLLLQLWMFATPIAYSPSIIPMRWQWLAKLNPMYGCVDFMRWILLSTKEFPAYSVGVSLAISIVVLSIAGMLFRQTEDRLVDVL